MTTPRPDALWAVDFDRLTRDHAEVIAHPSHEHGQCRTCMQPYPCTIARLLAVRADAEREVARLRAAIPEDPYWHGMGIGSGAGWFCFWCREHKPGHRSDCAWLATRPPTPSPEQGGEG